MDTETEDSFFDTRQVFDSMSDSESERSSSSSDEPCSTSGINYDSWFGNLDSVDERRNKFISSVGISPKWAVTHENREKDDFQVGLDETKEEKVEAKEKVETSAEQSLELDDAILIRQPSLSCWSNLGVKQDENRQELDKGTSEKQSFDFGSSSQRKESENVATTLLDRRKKGMKGWLKKLNVMARINHHMDSTTDVSKGIACTREVQVHTNKKKSRELSAVYTTQDFPAHNGSILVLKFCHDGRYLASAGDDGIVRVWEVSENDDTRNYEIQGNDPSKVYYTSNHLSELAPINVGNDKPRKIKKSSELTCVILPPKVFRILDKPIHEFHGHTGQILSLSWSKNGLLLSSSEDKTVRLWKVGRDDCLKVFTHNNYVTCVEFNPMNENHFISASIDGKVRIWEISGTHVVEWIDLREIVTAVCYYTNGEGCLVGTLDGNCSFYDIIDERLTLDTNISVMSKKKWPRRITGFQFCPTDSRKVIVSSADAQVRVLCGVNVVGKFKGNRSSGSQMAASFTADGKHIVSAGDDSNIYMWNHATPDKLYTKPKSNLSSESFSSQNSSIAIPWSGMKTIAGAFPSPRLTNTNEVVPRSTIKSPRVRGGPSLSSSRSFFLKSPPTFPSETLPDPTQVSVSPSMRKSEYRFLRSAYRSTFVAPHTWGLVIVTAGLDGRIRTYLNYGLPIRQ